MRLAHCPHLGRFLSHLSSLGSDGKHAVRIAMARRSAHLFAALVFVGLGCCACSQLTPIDGAPSLVLDFGACARTQTAAFACLTQRQGSRKPTWTCSWKGFASSTGVQWRERQTVRCTTPGTCRTNTAASISTSTIRSRASSPVSCASWCVHTWRHGRPPLTALLAVRSAPALGDMAHVPVRGGI